MKTCPTPSANEIGESWTYDPTNGIGELATESSTHGSGTSTVNTYNAASPTPGLLGQIATKWVTIAAHAAFNYSYNYDADNRPSSYTSPSGAQPATVYNSAGYVAQLTDGPGGPAMYTVNARDAENRILSASWGNGITTSYSYYQTRSEMTGLLTHDTPTGSNVVQNITYSWDQLGNLQSRVDTVNNLTEVYVYDELDRLLTILEPGGVTENSFTYDVLGNMLTKAGVGTYAYPAAGSAHPHGVTTITPSGSGSPTTITYDLDGQVSSEAGPTARSFTWTPSEMPATIQLGSGTAAQFHYDADNNRAIQAIGSNKTYYLPDGELTPSTGSGAVFHTYFMMDGQRVAEDAGPSGALVHHYFQNDYQNSIGLVTLDNYVFGNAASTAQNEGSDVFGQPRLPNGAPDATWGANDVTGRRWINQEDLLDSHLIDLNARVYDPLLGKFMSPDPIISDQDDSQSWNAYAYSHNNPMSREDPTGLASCPADKPCEEVTATQKPKQKPVTVLQGGGSAAPVLHLPAGINRLAIRAAQGGPSSAPAHSLIANYGLVAGTGVAVDGTGGAALGGVAGNIAAAAAACLPCDVAAAVLWPTRMGTDDKLSTFGAPASQLGSSGDQDQNDQATTVFSKPPRDAKDPDGAKAPGKPGEAEGFRDPKSGEKWGKAPNGKSGWIDDKGHVWVPTGKAGARGTGTTGPAHGGPHWDVQDSSGGYRNVRPRG